jgi:hypothetical protein
MRIDLDAGAGGGVCIVCPSGHGVPELVIDSVRAMTLIAPADNGGRSIGEPIPQAGVVDHDGRGRPSAFEPMRNPDPYGVTNTQAKRHPRQPPYQQSSGGTTIP